MFLEDSQDNIIQQLEQKKNQGENNGNYIKNNINELTEQFENNIISSENQNFYTMNGQNNNLKDQGHQQNIEINMEKMKQIQDKYKDKRQMMNQQQYQNQVFSTNQFSKGVGYDVQNSYYQDIDFNNLNTFESKNNQISEEKKEVLVAFKGVVIGESSDEDENNDKNSNKNKLTAEEEQELKNLQNQVDSDEGEGSLKNEEDQEDQEQILKNEEEIKKIQQIQKYAEEEKARQSLIKQNVNAKERTQRRNRKERQKKLAVEVQQKQQEMQNKSSSQFLNQEQSQSQSQSQSELETESPLKLQQKKSVSLENQDGKNQKEEDNVQNLKENCDDNKNSTPDLDEERKLLNSNNDQQQFVKKQNSSSFIPRGVPDPNFQIKDMKEFLTNPLPKGYKLQVTIRRDKAGLGKLYPKYHVYNSHGFRYMMSCKKRSGNKTSNYLIGMDKNELDRKSKGFLGKVRGNFLGTQYHIYDTGENPNKTKSINLVRQELCTILYDNKLMKQKGPTRNMRIMIPDIEEETGKMKVNKPIFESDTLLGRYKKGSLKDMQYFHNKPPKWSPELNAFVLNFNGRVDKPSIKNFQIIDYINDDLIYLQFGRVGNDIFNMDCQYPFSPLQAFGICISTFDFKLGME